MREHSAGAVIFRRQGDKILFLLLQSERGHWEFPKGLVEKGENEEDAARREVKEEVGIEDLSFIGGFKKTINYFFTVPDESWRLPRGARVFKTVNFYLAETKTRAVKISSEHKNFKWLEFKEATLLFNYKNHRDILEAARQEIKEAGG